MDNADTKTKQNVLEIVKKIKNSHGKNKKYDDKEKIMNVKEFVNRYDVLNHDKE